MLQGPPTWQIREYISIEIFRFARALNGTGSPNDMNDVKRTMEFAATLIGDDGEYLYSEWELDQVASASASELNDPVDARDAVRPAADRVDR
jgi:hypothetical protein